VTLSYGQTYHSNGWTILPATSGTRFTNDSTGPCIFVSVDNVTRSEHQPQSAELLPPSAPLHLTCIAVLSR
jgi:hypothetical protein